MNLLWLILGALVFFYLFGNKIEHLRIHGLQGVGALRGEPLGAPECGDQGFISPWNIGSSCPTRNRRMTME